jgi:hypothetical protein
LTLSASLLEPAVTNQLKLAVNHREQVIDNPAPPPPKYAPPRVNFMYSPPGPPIKTMIGTHMIRQRRGVRVDRSDRIV